MILTERNIHAVRNIDTCQVMNKLLVFYLTFLLISAEMVHFILFFHVTSHLQIPPFWFDIKHLCTVTNVLRSISVKRMIYMYLYKYKKCGFETLLLAHQTTQNIMNMRTYIDMHVRWYTCTVICMYNDMHVQWYACTVICMYGGMHVRWYACTVILHVEWYARTVICTYSDMHVQWYKCTII